MITKKKILVLLTILSFVFVLNGTSNVETKETEKKDNPQSIKKRAPSAQKRLAKEKNTEEEKPQSAPDRILVKYKKQDTIRVQEATRASIEAAYGIQSIRYFSFIDVYLYKTYKDKEKTLEKLRKNPNIEYAEPDYIKYLNSNIPNDPFFGNQWGLHNTGQTGGTEDADTSKIPNDPYFEKLWGLHNTGQTGGTEDADIDAPEAWDLTTGSIDVIVAVIDSGVDYNHEDLKANMWTNPGELPNNGIDDDGNGYVDDYYGINAVEDSGDPMDENGYGTHVSGIIGAAGNNGVGVVGVCWTAKIMALKFSGADGGYTSQELECINYAINNGAHVINASFNNRNYSQTEKEAIEAAREAGILFIAAAGGGGGWILTSGNYINGQTEKVAIKAFKPNIFNNNDYDPFYPASYNLDNIISVAASGHTDYRLWKRWERAYSYSKYGRFSVDVYAPGDDIYSTLPNNEYGNKYGTSQAAAHVTGLAALIKSYNSTLTWQQIKNRIMYGVDKPESLDRVLTNGRINAINSLTSTDPSSYTIDIRSSPDTEVFIEISPTDTDGLGSGNTNFSRSYSPYTEVTITAPAVHNGKKFHYWTLDGSIVDFCGSIVDYFREGWNEEREPIITLPMDFNHTLTAHYPLYSLDVQSRPETDVYVVVEPSDYSGQKNGHTNFERLYSHGTTVYLTASPTHNGKNFVYWQPFYTGYRSVDKDFNRSISVDIYDDKVLWIYGDDDRHVDDNPHDIETKVEAYYHSRFKWVHTERSIEGYAIGPDGTIYITSRQKLLAIDSDGTKKWDFDVSKQINPDVCSPAIGSDGTVYCGDKELYAVNPDGTVKWVFQIDKANIATPLALGSDGTVYFGVSDKSYPWPYKYKFFAVNPDGTKKWEFDVEGEIVSSPTIGSDGTIYFFNEIDYVAGSGKLNAINPDGSKKWEFDLDQVYDFHYLVSGSDGTLYFCSSKKLHALFPDGTTKWEYQQEGGGPSFDSGPSIGSDGTIYTGWISRDEGLLAINPDGTKKWEFYTDNEEIHSFPTIGQDGTVYFGMSDKIYALNPDGTKKWEFDSYSIFPPAIAPDGTIYFGHPDTLYALQSDSAGLASSPWPRHGQNNRNTNRAPSSTDMPPSVSITSPSDSATVSGTVQLQASASDDILVTKVEFYIDDELKSTHTTSPYSYSWDTSTYSYKTYKIKAVAYDSASQTDSHEISVTLTQGPVISGAVKTEDGTGLEGVIFTFSDGGGTASSDADGNYSRRVSYGWSGTVTPKKAGYAFVPPDRNYTNVTSDLKFQDYTASVSYINPGDIYSVDNIVGNMRYVPGIEISSSGFTQDNLKSSQLTDIQIRNIAVMETKVTQGMWADFVFAWPVFPEDPLAYSEPGQFRRGPSYPLHGVNWHYAVTFANCLSMLNGLTPCYYTDSSKTTPINASHFYNNNYWPCTPGIPVYYWWELDFIYCDFNADGYRLPRDAEWTYFCQGGYGLRDLILYYEDLYYGKKFMCYELVWDAQGCGKGIATCEPSESTTVIGKSGDNCGHRRDNDSWQRGWLMDELTFRLVRTIPPEITSLKPKYDGFVYYLKETDFEVTYTAEVDWKGHPPGLVRFVTSKGNYDVSTADSTASYKFNMGSEFDSCKTLKAIAISTDGAQSKEKEAEFIVMPPFLSNLELTATDEGSSFHYDTTKSFSLNFISDEGLGEGEIPEDIPLFGGKSFNLSFIPELIATASSDGKVEIMPDVSVLPSATGSMAGFEYELDQPTVDIYTNMKPDCTYEEWDGSVGIGGSFSKSLSWPFPIGPVPLYIKAGFNISASGALNVKNIDPVEYDGGEISVKPEIEGSVGVGADRLVSAEGWIKGGADFTLQYPQTPTLKELTVYFKAGLRAIVFSFPWETELLSWEWDVYGSSSAYMVNVTPIFTLKKRPIARDYLDSRGSFGRKTVHSYKGLDSKGQWPSVELSSLQESVYPYSYAHLSAIGEQMSLVWVKDNENRSSINRTMAVYSSFDGTDWSEPLAIWDDGTADFHPRAVTFSDGTVIASWEDTKTTLEDTAQLEDVVANMEISASVFNPATQQWELSQRMSSNTYFDASPLISGKTKGDAMLVWVANESDDIHGSSVAPNKVYFSRYDGAGWSEPTLAAEVAMGILKYELLYGGGKGYLVLSCDIDDDSLTIDDHELYMLAYEKGSWGSLTRLTTDSVVDDNPQMVEDSDGNYILAWMSVDGVYSVNNFDMSSRTLIIQDQYSSNLADFRLSASESGRVALVWAEPSGFGSDLMASCFDPVSQLWLTPQQLTTDKETERHITSSFYGNNTWIAVFNRSIMGESQVTQAEIKDKSKKSAIPVLISTDLYMVKLDIEDIFFPTPEISLNRTSLYFGAEASGSCTSSQKVIISSSGTGSLNWTVAPSESWMDVSPASGTGNGIFEVSADPSRFSLGTYNGTITVTDPNASNSPQIVNVTLIVYSSGAIMPPFGYFDTPADGTTGITGAIPVTGWALDDIEVTKVEIKRDAHASDSPAAIGRDGLVYIGDAVFVEGPRPDIEQAYHGYPFNYKAGWGYMLLTNFLPNQGNGTYRIHAIAYDKDGHNFKLGVKTITCDNANAILPFGTIDTPGQGGEASGSAFMNWGWVLTPQPNSIPTDGSTILVWVDGVAVGNVDEYNLSRPDITALFPGYANTDGAVGYYRLDTTQYSNGVYTLAWSAVDSGGNVQGIGSRYFVIFNTQAGATSRRVILDSPISFDYVQNLPLSFEPLRARRGYRRDIEPEILEPDPYGVMSIEIREVERVELDLGDGVDKGYMVVGEELRALPIGSTLDASTGTFSWQPGPGFIGDYDFVFIMQAESGLMRRIRTRIRILPKFNLR